MKTILKHISLLFIVLLYSNSSFAQRDFTMQIVLDQKVDAGDLTLFPGVKDKNSYWYLPNQLQLATNDDGTPKLSFVKWVHNEENDTDEGIGGGVLHCVFGFNVTEEQLDEARRELRSINGQGKIIGSAIYKRWYSYCCRTKN